MIDRDHDEDEAEELDVLEQPLTVADAVAALSTLRTALAGLDGMIRRAISDLVGEEDEEDEEPDT